MTQASQILAGGNIECELPSVMTIETVYDMLNKILGIDVTVSEIDINAGNVEVVTTPGLQLLVAFDRSLAKNGRFLHIKNATVALEQACKMAGLEDTYTKWTA